MIRHQRSRRRGARQPEGVRYVGRGTAWGNPFTTVNNSRDGAFRLYHRMVDNMTDDDRAAWLAPLRGLVGLSCFCALDQQCHADVLIEWLEAEQ